MTDIISKLKEAEAADLPDPTPFGEFEEEAIVSLALDNPEFFTSVGRFLTPSMFKRVECQYVITHILNAFEKYDIVPTRHILRDRILADLTEDDQYEEVLALVDRKANFREVPIVKDLLLKWARDRAYGQIYSEEALAAYERGDYAYIEKLMQEANRIEDVGQKGFWFFENYHLLFEPDIIDHRTTGFPSLDKMLNNGGPSPKEVLCWLAPTNLGKCHTLDSKIIEQNLSRIYEIELEDGQIYKFAGYQRLPIYGKGLVRVCDLQPEDSIIGFPELADDTADITICE